MLLARILAAAKARARRVFIFPTPLFLPASPERFGARSAPSVLFKKGSDFVKQTHRLLGIIL